MIGIDISPTACQVMAKRLRGNTTLREDEVLWKEEQRTIILLTVKELLDGNFAHNLV